MTWTRKEVIPVLVVGAVAALIGWFVGHAQAPHAQPPQPNTLECLPTLSISLFLLK